MRATGAWGEVAISLIINWTRSQIFGKVAGRCGHQQRHARGQLGKLTTRSANPEKTGTYESDAVGVTSSDTSRMQTDPDLVAVVAAWPDLPGAVKAGIVAMVGAAKSKDV